MSKTNLDKLICNTNNTINLECNNSHEKLEKPYSNTISESTRTKNERLAQTIKNNDCYLCINKETNKCKVCHQIICNDHATYNKYCIKCYNDKLNYDFYPSPPPMLPSFKYNNIINENNNE